MSRTWPLLERMRSDGAVVLVKLDGERHPPDDNGPYTVLASGAPLQGEYIRTDAETLEAALSYVIIEYARRVWGLEQGRRAATEATGNIVLHPVDRLLKPPLNLLSSVGVLNMKGYFDGLVSFLGTACSEGFIRPKDSQLIHFKEDF